MQQRYSMYTKEEKPHDRKTSHKLEQVNLHYYRNMQFSTRLLYTYTPYVSYFCLSISLLSFLSLLPTLFYHLIRILYFTS